MSSTSNTETSNQKINWEKTFEPLLVKPEDEKFNSLNGESYQYARDAWPFSLICSSESFRSGALFVIEWLKNNKASIEDLEEVELKINEQQN